MIRYKITMLLLIIILLCTSTIGVNAFKDVPDNANYADALNHLVSLGIVGSGDDESSFDPDGIITREQFAKAMVVAAGLEEDADLNDNSTIFSDVSKDRWSIGYINVAVDSGFITGMADGKFHPEEGVTFAQICTIMVNTLGYDDDDVSGVWPKSYIRKAKSLGLTDGISLNSNDEVPRWAAVIMVENLLNEPMKSDESTTFGDQSGLYTEIVVLGDSSTIDGLSDNQILSDSGIYYVNDKNIKLNLGRKYQLKIEDDVVEKVYGDVGRYLDISVNNASDTTVEYKQNGKAESITLPDKTIYYYEGVEQEYEDISSLLQVNTSIILLEDEESDGYEYGIIVDSVYSEPEIVKSITSSLKKIENISIGNNIKITRNGKIINANQIEKNDVVYEVSDIWGENKYILVVDNQIYGEITDILPNKISPKKVEIEDVEYELSDDMDLSKINGLGAFSVDDTVTALLGYDGTVVDITQSGVEDNSDYALVINNYEEKSTDIEDYGNDVYYVKLLHTNGTTKTYKIDEDSVGYQNGLGYEGRLVKYKIIEDEDDEDEDDEDVPDTVKLWEIDDLDDKSYTINRDERMIDSTCVSDNVVIFDMIHDVTGSDSEAQIVNWSELTNGTIASGKIKYINKVGDFGDVSVIFADNIFDENFRLGIVNKVQREGTSTTGYTYTYTILIDGEEYTSSDYIVGVVKGTVVRVKLYNGSINYIDEKSTPWDTSTKVVAIDEGRIKIDDAVYKFNSDVTIYSIDNGGTSEAIGIDEIDVDEKYGKVSIYLDKPKAQGGKVEVIVIDE